ncbi:TatD family hydrolase [Leptolyngbya sp. FACHB-261]|uniref:TatD family hydrolase n=1 Tax=Leptolyngbya sp. FACHB-261 TaxID=2692806 RepID=UPI001689CEC4|nr:TatD family hydrolase [Leptolyngbya sp. FACHB-261]MBD2104864.1 TatD family hydrolase [Leptolyngbya sp. FACHB-261]
MPSPLIDSHVHLNFESFQQDLDATAQRWREAGVVRLIHSCVEPAEFSQIQALADRFPELSFAVGLHPLDADKAMPELLDQLRSLAASDRRVVALGEMGLDFYKADNQAQQELVFRAQLALARELDLPVIIHCRDAAARMYELLLAVQAEGPPVRGVMHCWGGTPEETSWFLGLGFYISFSGTVTFKNATQIQASVAVVPDERLLIETDCPFLSPVPKRGKRNEPAFVQYVAQQVAQLRGLSLESLAELTTHNAAQLFRLSLNDVEFASQILQT